MVQFRTESYVTDWTQLQVGIAMECSVSPILFALAMQVLLKGAEAYAESVELGKAVHMPPLKAFVDDTTVLSNHVAKTQ